MSLTLGLASRLTEPLMLRRPGEPGPLAWHKHLQIGAAARLASLASRTVGQSDFAWLSKHILSLCFRCCDPVSHPLGWPFTGSLGWKLVPTAPGWQLLVWDGL